MDFWTLFELKQAHPEITRMLTEKQKIQYLDEIDYAHINNIACKQIAFHQPRLLMLLSVNSK